MLPIWAKGKAGNWVRFPAEVLRTREDGKLVARTDRASLDTLDAFLRATNRPVKYYFKCEESSYTGRWVLRGKRKRK